MFKTIVFSAFGAALAVCLAVSARQFVTTEPLILHAEQFEGGAHDHASASSAASVEKPRPSRLGLTASHLRVRFFGEQPPHPEVRDGDSRRASKDEAVVQLASASKFEETTLVLVHTAGPEVAGAAEAEEWGPADGLERTLYTVLANFVIGFAVSLLLLGAMVLKGDPIDARRGLLWGIAGFAALSLLPALGLPPELPGTPAADIFERQTWWLAAAAASAGGIALLVFGRHWALMAAGVALILAPHVVGAPLPPSHDVTYPGALAGEFVIASLVVSALLWSLSGLAAGGLYERFSRAS